MTTLFRYPAGAIALLVAGATVLTGCSSSGASGDGANRSASVSVPASALVQSGHLTLCSDISAPPLTYYDAQQKVVGAEAELGSAWAKQLGLSVTWKNTAFNGIIPALQAKQCDAIVSQLYIKPEREKVLDFVPYMYASNTLVVAKDHAQGISGVGDLCGKKAAAQTGTTVASYLMDQSKTKCVAAGKPKIGISLFAKDSDALQQLKLGLVDCYGTTLETAAYVSKKQPNTFTLVGKPFNRIRVGAATLKSNKALHNSLGKALAAIEKNGQYASILKKWNLTGDDISGS